jgi:hypothetical protein
MNLITIRPGPRNNWKLEEKDGISLLYAKKDDAIDYAQDRYQSTAGEIRIMNAAGEIEQIIKTNAGPSGLALSSGL